MVIRDRNRNKCTINETSRLYVKVVEISRSDETFTSPKIILEVPFVTPRKRHVHVGIFGYHFYEISVSD